MAEAAKRYRAYAEAGKDGAPGSEEVVSEGALTDGAAAFNAGRRRITRVVFYSGPASSEVVAGEVRIDKAGAINVSLPE